MKRQKHAAIMGLGFNVAPILIFFATYLTLALGRFPGLRVDRTGATIIGASLMVASGTLEFKAALAAVDWPTIVLLLGMMIVVSNLRLSGFFRLAADWVVRRAHHPSTLLAGVVAVSGVLSALFVNDTICLVMTPLVIEIALTLGRNPVPYLLAVAMASNAGSVATITGNPQNMMIGALSRIPYRTFTASMAPVAVFALVATWVVLRVVYRREFEGVFIQVPPDRKLRLNKPLLWKSLAVSVGMVAFFFGGTPVAETAIVAGALLLVTRRVKPERVYRDVDWALLAMFAGLFIVVAGVDRTPLASDVIRFGEQYGLHRIPALAFFSAALSNVVSNVPAVLVFRPLVASLTSPETGWLTLAMASTLAGNFTILASVANLIVVEKARPAVTITFRDYFKAGAPLTVVSLAGGVVWLMLTR